MRIRALASIANLELAWRRINTGKNHQYKKYFRDLYYAYELALPNHLRNLREALLSGTWKPKPPARVYLPKPSGLHRPLTLLYLEDQIVLQGIANLMAKKLANRRKKVVMKYVFSNVLSDSKSIFFVKDWRRTYSAFQKKVRGHYINNLKWVADFDLAAFYDTISHDLLFKNTYPRSHENEDLNMIRNYMQTWSSTKSSSSYGHGIPQGPIASDFLAECFLLPIDEALMKRSGYTRYVDDIRLFGKTEKDVREAVIELEIRCRERGLIPQSGKFLIKHASSYKEALGMLPSIAAPRDEDTAPGIPPEEAIPAFMASLDINSGRIEDRTRARFVLYRAEPCEELQRAAIRLLPQQPEHIDSLISYLRQCGISQEIWNVCRETSALTPYEYVRGELWQVMASMLRSQKIWAVLELDEMVEEAIMMIKDKKVGFAGKLGAGSFLAEAERITQKKLTRWFNFLENPLLQALLGSLLPPSAITAEGPAPKLFARTAFEPGISLTSMMHQCSIKPSAIGVPEHHLAQQIQDTLKILGLGASSTKPQDPISKMLDARFQISTDGIFRKLLGNEYNHAAGLLVQADAVYRSGPSHWLSYQNSFNHALFLALQKEMAARNFQGAVSTINAKGQLISFGANLDNTNTFSKFHPVIATAFRAVNDRRNKLPGSHPYDTKTKGRNRFLKSRERDYLGKMLGKAYMEISNLVNCFKP